MDVAIIGSAVLLPEAADPDGLHELLAAGRDTVRAPSPDRLRAHGLPPGTDCLPMAYLDRIDLFDHAFFGISRRDAELMDPHQRLVLQLAHEAVENAGYAPSALRGSRAAVMLGYARSDYYELFGEDDPQQIMGLIGAAMAARICYVLGLTGPALVIDTACSSSLAAVAQAVAALRSGTADLALAGGISVRPVLIRRDGHTPLRGVESPEGHCRPFDEKATGTTGGEGGGIVVLKLLPDALAAGDNVQAVIKGVAVNHNGRRIASMSAPSQAAQTEVITDAWADARVEGASVRYVECHGSGTPLGDVVEVDALQRAFAGAGVTGPHCVIGSVKGNIGHLDSAAGVAGLMKVILSLRRATLYPTANFTAPSPLIDFSGPVQVSPAERPWPVDNGGPRLAGLSAFGLTGTNVHTVIAEPPPVPSTRPAGVAGPELITVSAKSAPALARYRDRLAAFAERTSHTLAEIACAMNRGRDDYPYRIAVTAGNKDELVQLLRAAPIPDSPAPASPPVVLLFSGDAEVGADCWQELGTACHDLDRGSVPDTAGSRLVAGQFARYRLARSLGVPDTHLAGSGAGNVTVKIARGEVSLADGLRTAAAMELSATVDQDRLRHAVAGFANDGAVLLEMGAVGVLSRLIRQLAPQLACAEFTAGAPGPGAARSLAALYRLGVALDWSQYYEGRVLARIEAPTYPFDPTRCWPSGPPPGTPTAPAHPAFPNSAPSPGTTAFPGHPGHPASPGHAALPGRPTSPTDLTNQLVGGDGALSAEAARVAEVWGKVLGSEGLELGSDYFALGGTSIAGITVLRTLEADFGVALTFADLYAYPTVQAFGDRLAELARSGERQAGDRDIAALPRGGRLPLSFGQEQLWYLDRLNPGSYVYNIPHDLHLRGPLDAGALTAAVRDMYQRHEVLRTRLPDDDGEPYAVAGPVPDVPVIDLTGLPAAARYERARRIANDEAVRPFDLTRGPLVRTTLVRLAADDHLLLWTYHHIVFDGWSPTVFFRDFSELYQARLAGRAPALPPLLIQYADYAAWQRGQLSGERLERALDFWRAELAGLERPELPLDRPRPPVQSFHGELIEFVLDEALATLVREFSQRHSVTTFVTMLALVDTLMHRWAGLTDVVIGVGTSGRVNPATHDLIGYFNNLPPFRTQVSGDLPFTALVQRCADTVAKVLDHEEIPLEKIVTAVCRSRDPGRHSLFDVAYTYQNVPQDTAELGGLTCTKFLDGGMAGIAPGTAKFDITVGIIDQQQGPMAGYIEYATALFSADTIRQLVACLPTLLAGAMRDPGQPLAGLPAPGLAGAEGQPPAASVSGQHGSGQDGAGQRANGQAPAAVAVAAPPDLVQRFEEWAARRPDHPAVVGPSGEVLTYGELNRLANRAARRLASAGVGPGVPVPVIVGRGPAMVAGWLAALKAGGAYVPFDPAAPRGRVDSLLAEIRPVTVLTGDDLRAGRLGDHDDGNLPPRAAPADLAYIAYTSGSTGPPQGCEVERRSVAGLVDWYCAETGIGAGDRLLQAVSPAFDAAVLEIWPALCSGATICFLPAMLTEPGALVRWLAGQRVTVAFLPTPMAEVMLTDCDWPAGVPLRVLATGGDQLRVRPPEGAPFRLLNVYGPTECTVVATAGYIDPEPAGAVPSIGRPRPGVEVRLLTPGGAEVPAGELGEVCIGGVAVGRGYHRRPGLTSARFVPDPFAGRPGARLYRTGDLARLLPDGTLHFSGRLDGQLEIRGNRVEPAEVEHTLRAHPLVREAVVVPARPAGERPGGAVRLVAHVTGAGVDTGELVTWAAARLPAYMLPAEVVVHTSLPITPNGKFDRRSLQKMPVPTATAEQVLTGICADLLGAASVSPADNFFDLGGDSVLGVRVAARAAKAGVHFTPQQLLQCQTLAELASVALTAEPAVPDGSQAAPVLLTAQTPPATPIPITPIMHSNLANVPDAAREMVDVHVLQTAPGVAAAAVRTALTHLFAQHETLRYRLRSNELGTYLECGDASMSRLFDVKVLPPLAPDEELAVVTRDCTAMKAAMDPEHGSLVRVRYYDRGRVRGGLIVMLISHFVFDNMSTVVVMDDLDTLLTDIMAGNTPAALVRPPRWREWAQHLRDMSVSEELAAELTFWTATMRGGVAAGPLSGPGAGDIGHQAIAARTIDGAGAAAVFTASTAEGREAATCAAAVGLARWQGSASAYVMTEGEATPNVFRPPGRGPSVGWFTSLHPLLLEIAPGAGVRDSMPALVDRIRSVPNDGLGYGMLRYLAPSSPAVDGLRALPEPQVMVVHGPSDAAAFDSGVRLLETRWDLSVNLKRAAAAWFPVAVLTAMREGALQLSVASTGLLDQDQAGALADAIAGACAELAGG